MCLAHFVFTISRLILFWNISHLRLLDLIPMARAAVFESMSDAVFVVDEQNCIVDLNGAAKHLAHCTASRAVGQPFTQIFAVWPELVGQFSNMTDGYAEIVLREGEALRFFSLRLSP